MNDLVKKYTCLEMKLDTVAPPYFIHHHVGVRQSMSTPHDARTMPPTFLTKPFG